MTEVNSHRLEAAAVDIRYGTELVLHKAQLRISGGGVHLLIGRNGAGKSSLLRSMAGLQSIQGGTIALNGQDVHRMTAADRAQYLAFVASTPPRTSQLRVDEVLGLAASASALIPKVLEQFGDARWLRRRLDALSDGEAQRVMFARAVLQETSWLFMDEPTAFLDVPSRKVFWKHAIEVAKNGTTIVLATHDYEHLATSVDLASVHLIEAKGVASLDALESPLQWTKRMEG